MKNINVSALADEVSTMNRQEVFTLLNDIVSTITISKYDNDKLMVHLVDVLDEATKQDKYTYWSATDKQWIDSTANPQLAKEFRPVTQLEIDTISQLRPLKKYSYYILKEDGHDTMSILIRRVEKRGI